MNSRPFANGRIAQIAFVAALLLAWFCYAPAITGVFQLDDRPNLEGLQDVSDLETGLDFILSGSAGPLGRPVALLTFALQADSWQQGAADFIRANILLHLLNAAILAFCVLRLSLYMSMDHGRATTNAVLVASVWVLLPLLATSSLMVVQRMTILSATFALLGLAGYLSARMRLQVAPQRALVWMSVSLVVGTLLSALCKESGLLLPVLVLALEATVLPRPDNPGKKLWRGWQLVFLGTPLLIILAYLATTVPYPEALALRRGFTGSERLLTEANLLWVYLFKAVFGHPDSLGIFQRAPAVARRLFEMPTLLSVLAWLTLLAAAIVWRRRWPLPALAILWFLAGHLIESTTVSLELYFEHRNYLPIIGPIFALGTFVLLLDRPMRLVGVALISLFVLINAFFLFVFASLWGEPSMAARHWAMRYPDSVRAVTTLATYQMSEEGALRGAQTLSRFVDQHPEHAYLRIQQLNIMCRITGSADHSQLVDDLQRRLPEVEFTYSAGTMLSQLFDASVGIDCDSLTPETVAALAKTLRNNPRYGQDAQYNQFHYKLLAGIARKRGDMDTALAHLRTAIDYRPSPELNFMMVTGLLDRGDFAAARQFMEDAHAAAPGNPLRAAKWHRDLHQLARYVDAMEKQGR